MTEDNSKKITCEECGDYNLCDYVHEHPEDFPKDFCIANKPECTKGERIMTNREWLNCLTDEELEYWFTNNSLCSFIHYYYWHFCCSQSNCRRCINKWLSEEHTEPKEQEENEL